MKSLLVILALTAPVLAQAPDPAPLSVVKKNEPQTFDLNWESLTGKTYFIRASQDLVSWQYLPEVMAGVGGDDTLGFSTLSDKFFFQLIRSDLPTVDLISADHDGDGIPSFAELTVTNTDPVKFSTAGDGTSDRALFPSPANGIYLDNDNGIQYSIVPDAGNASSAGRIVALHHFEAPDYRIEYQVGELNLEKHGFEPFVETTENIKTRYLNRLKGLGGQIKADNSTLTGIWQLGFTFSSNGQRVVYATNDDQEITTVDALTGDEVVNGQISSTDPSLYIPPRLIAGDWDWNQEDWRGEWFDPSNGGNLLYDISPFHPFWDGGAWLYYEDYLYNENTMDNVINTATSNPPTYSSVWQEGNPWGIWDKWESELGVSYRRFKFRIVNKGAVDAENPALATVFFKPENSNEVEEVMSVEWDGSNTTSPVYEIDPHQLRPNVDGTFYINAATVAFEVDLAQKDSRLSGNDVILFMPDSSIGQPVALAAPPSEAQISPPPEGAKLAQVKFPGMNDSWYQDADITMSVVSGTGAIKMIAYDPNTGNQVIVPFSQNIARDFFHSKGAYHGWDWYVQTEQPGELQIKVQYSKGEKVMELTRNAIVLSAKFAVDANRNGNIEFDNDYTTLFEPYRFWVNDDTDTYEDEENPSSVADHNDGIINTRRDLEDFSRIQLKVEGLHEQLKSGEITANVKFREGSVEGNPAVNLWFHLDDDGGRSYLLDDQAATRHFVLRDPGKVTKTNAYTLPLEFWAGKNFNSMWGIYDYPAISADNPYRNLLFEGAGEGKGELVLELKRGGQVLGEVASCWLHLLNVRKMYERVKVTPDNPASFEHPYYWGGKTSEIYAEPPAPVMDWVHDPFGHDFVPDPLETKEYIVFVHGWRMTYEGAQKYGETMFKRLWRSGYKGRYAFVRWPTYSEETNPITNGLFTYNDSDYRAWISGKGLEKFVNSLPVEYVRNLTAHSMGNIVAGSALREGMQVDKYILLNAAVPAMCYDNREALYEFNRDTPDGDTDPITSGMGFADKITNTNGAELINFYLPNDSALATWEANNLVFKPQRIGAVGYSYDETKASGEKIKLDLGVIEEVSFRYLRSYHEAAAFATASRTKTVGADGRTAGSIVDKVDMGATYGFGETHSAEWLWRFQKTHNFYHDFMQKLGLDPIPAP